MRNFKVKAPFTFEPFGTKAPKRRIRTRCLGIYVRMPNDRLTIGNFLVYLYRPKGKPAEMIG